MGKKHLTVLIFSEKASQVKKFILSPRSLKAAAILCSLLVVVVVLLLYDYVNYKRKFNKIEQVQIESIVQREEILSFMEKINILEEELARLREMEKQVQKELREVQELRKQKNVKRISVPPAPNRKPDLTQGATLLPAFRKEDVSVLEKERPQLISRLHQDLLELHRESYSRTQDLKELVEFLQTQKSYLLSVPSLWPVVGRITSRFGDTRFSGVESGGLRPHMGLDIAAPPGTPVAAPAMGVVTSAGREPHYGLLVGINHGHGFFTLYGHLSRIHVREGQTVKEGQIIGTVGSTGYSSGPHLHYEVHLNGRHVNPLLYLNRQP